MGRGVVNLPLEVLLKLAELLVNGKVSKEEAAKVIAGTAKVSGDRVIDKVKRNKVIRDHWTKRVQKTDHGKATGSREEVLGMGMTEAQKEAFLAIDEFWKVHGFSPSVRDVARMRGKGVSNTQKVINKLVKIGAVKRIEGMQRTLRPVYVRFRDIE